MKLQRIGNTDPKERWDVPSGLGKSLLLMHPETYEEFNPYPLTRPDGTPNITTPIRWKVITINAQPAILAACDNCGHDGHDGRKIFQSASGKAHEQVFSCLHRVGTQPPQDVVDLYLRTWKQFAAKHVAVARPKFYGRR
jgi:hypothetical protein